MAMSLPYSARFSVKGDILVVLLDIEGCPEYITVRAASRFFVIDRIDGYPL
jgi:hypothetical protein